MARPKKQTVDYFPHIANSGKTMFILESKFGNDGYAFWFKLLELLATTDGHVYDCRNSAHWQFLLAKTNQGEESANNILSLLADLEAIDKELWRKKVIWCQNLVDNITDVYKKRKAEVPQKPDINSFCEQKPTSAGVSTDGNSSKEDIEEVSTSENPQSKVKETKVNKTKGKENNSSNVHRFYQENFGMANSHIVQDLESWSNDLSSDVVLLALQKAIEKDAPYSYAKAIMKNWAAKDIKTVEDAEAESLSKRKQKAYSTKSKARSESLPDWVDKEVKDEKLSAEEEKAFIEQLNQIRAMKGGG